MSSYQRSYESRDEAFGARYSNSTESASRNRYTGWDIGGANFKVGQFYDVQDHKQQWYEAEVVDVKYSRNNPPRVELVKFHFLFWSEKYDEEYEPDSHRIAPHMSRIYLPGTELLIKHRIDVLDVSERNTRWRPATVVDIAQEEVMIHYANYPRHYDEWIKRDSGRIMPYGHKSKSNSEDFEKVINFHYRSSEQKGPNSMSAEKYGLFVQKLASMEGGLSIYKAGADGNCLFRSVSHQLYGTEENHDLIRAKCVEYMELMGSFFENFFVWKKEAYFENMRKDGVWGGEPEIQAILELYDRPVAIYVYDCEENAKKILRGVEVHGERETGGIIRLSYEGGNHYNSIVGESHQEHLFDSHNAGEVENIKLKELLELVEQEKLDAVAAGGDADGEGKKEEDPAKSERQEKQIERRLSIFRKDVKFNPISNELNWGDIDLDDDPELQAALAASMSPNNSPPKRSPVE